MPQVRDEGIQRVGPLPVTLLKCRSPDDDSDRASNDHRNGKIFVCHSLEDGHVLLLQSQTPNDKRGTCPDANRQSEDSSAQST